jgi:hypothetical protein
MNGQSLKENADLYDYNRQVNRGGAALFFA